MSEDKKNIKRPTAAILIIGDEILSGRTLDTNSNYLAGVLTANGISLLQIKIIPDDKSIIVSTVNELRKNHTYVFTSGGIGPTHDDVTAEAIAKDCGIITGQLPKVLPPQHARKEFVL